MLRLIAIDGDDRSDSAVILAFARSGGALGEKVESSGDA
jgi:hypothetical protein